MSYQLNPLLEGKISNFLKSQGLMSKRQVKKVRKQAAKALKDIRSGKNYKKYKVGVRGLDSKASNNALRFSNDARSMQDSIYNQLKGDQVWSINKPLSRVM